MIERKNGGREWLLITTLLAASVAAARPPIEARKPHRPAAEASRPLQTRTIAEGPNSGGPGSPDREAGLPAPAAEAVTTKPGQEGRWIWANRQPVSGEPRLLPAEILRNARPATQTASLPTPGKPSTPAPVATPATPSTPAVPATPQVIPARSTDPLDAQVDKAISLTARRVLIAETTNLNERTHTPWQIGHGMLAFRQDYMIRVNGQKVRAFDWIKKNPTFRTQKEGEVGTAVPWFYLTPYGARPQRYNGVTYEFEGHPNQFLAFLATARIPLDFEFTIQGRKVTYGQMLHNAKMEINDREEVTWDLWAFAYYFDMNESWKNAAGESWSMERLVNTTLHQFSPTNSPCGGCHALFALASARNAYLQSGNRLSGVWTRAHMHLEQQIALAKSQQNRDGSFSSNYFKGPGYASDPSKRISTTGHTLEFLMLALQHPRINEPWVRNAVTALSRDLIQYQREPLEVGGMYHAAHALVLYRERTRPELATAARPLQPASGEVDRNLQPVPPTAARDVPPAPAPAMTAEAAKSTTAKPSEPAKAPESAKSAKTPEADTEKKTETAETQKAPEQGGSDKPAAAAAKEDSNSGPALISGSPVTEAKKPATAEAEKQEGSTKK